MQPGTHTRPNPLLGKLRPRPGTSDVGRYLTTEEAASYLRVSTHALRCMRYRGDAPPAARVGRGLLWTQQALDDWVQARTTLRPETRT